LAPQDYLLQGEIAMIRSLSVLIVVVAGFSSWSLPAPAATTNMSRREIRQTPVLERPSRPGHFYGNTVRRNHRHG
jgi:hypothetical protein